MLRGSTRVRRYQPSALRFLKHSPINYPSLPSHRSSGLSFCGVGLAIYVELAGVVDEVRDRGCAIDLLNEMGMFDERGRRVWRRSRLARRGGVGSRRSCARRVSVSRRCGVVLRSLSVASGRRRVGSGVRGCWQQVDPGDGRSDLPTSELVMARLCSVDYGSRTRKSIRRDGSAGSLVAGAGPDRCWPDRVRDLFDRGGGDGVRLRLHGGRRAVPLAFLLPGSEELGTARVVHVCVLRDLGAAGLPSHLLLLPQGVLPVVLPRPACVRGRRSAPPSLPR